MDISKVEPLAIRSTNVLINGNTEFTNSIREASEIFTEYSKKIILTLAKMRGVAFRYREKGGDEVICVSQEEIDRFLSKHKDDAKVFIGGFAVLETTHIRPFIWSDNNWKPNPKTKTWTKAKDSGLKLLSAGLLPLIYDEDERFQSRGVRASLISGARSLFKNWLENDKLVKDHKLQLEKEVKEERERINVDDNLWALFQEFISLVEQKYNVKINGRFCKKLKTGKLLENLQKGKSPSKSCYDPKIFEVLLERFNPIVHCLLEYCEHLCTIRQYDRYSDNAILTLPNVKLPVDLHLGPSYIPYDVKERDGRLVLRTKIFDEEYEVECFKSRYLQDLQISPCDKNYEFTFRKSGQLVENGILKEIWIRLRGNRIYVSLPLNMRRRRCDDLYADTKIKKIALKGGEKEKITWDEYPLLKSITYFNFAIGNNEDQTYKSCVRMGLTCLSVDSNLHPLAATCTYTLEEDCKGEMSFPVEGFGYANCKSIDRFGDIENSNFYWSVKRFIDKMWAFGRIKGYLGGLLKQDVDGLPECEDLDLLDMLKNLENMSDPVWVKNQLVITYQNLRSEFRKFKNEHRNNSRLNAEYLLWIFAVKKWTSVARGWRYFGKLPAKRGEKRDPTDFQAIDDYLKGLKRNFLNKFGRAIRDIAVKNGAHIITLEDHQYLRAELKNSYMLALTPQSIRNAIENSVKLDGIEVHLVDPRYSSQEDPLTGEPAFRDKDINKTHIYLDRGKIVREDADLTASLVLQRRFWMRHIDINHLSCIMIENAEEILGAATGSAKMVKALAIPKLDGKRVKGALGHKYGQKCCIFEKTEDVFKLVPISEKDHKIWLKKKGKVKMLHRIGEDWLVDEQYYSRLEEIKHRYVEDMPLLLKSL